MNPAMHAGDEPEIIHKVRDKGLEMVFLLSLNLKIVIMKGLNTGYKLP